MLTPVMLAILLQTQEIPKKYVDAAAAIELPKDLDGWKEKSAQHRKAVETIADRALWARGLQLIDEKLGLFVAGPRIKVTVAESDEPRPAKGKGRKGVGEVQFNIKRMVEYIRKLEAFEEMRIAGKEVTFRVPPTPLPALIHHELTHCFAGTYDELWLTEGLATWVAEETAQLWDFQNRKARLDALDREMGEREAYARGYCALAWLDAKHGRDKLKAFVAKIVEDKSSARKALQETAGLEWEKLVAQELEWSRELLRTKFTPRD